MDVGGIFITKNSCYEQKMYRKPLRGYLSNFTHRNEERV